MLHRVGRYLDGKVPDSMNLIQACKEKMIYDPKQMTEELLQVELFFRNNEMDVLKAKALELHR